MENNFSLFSSPLKLAHYFWERLLCQDDLVVDATCGNGKDTLELARILTFKGGGEIVCIDLQKEAILATKELLKTHAPLFFPHLYFYEQSHEIFPEILFTKKPKLIVYNLGYLPGGNKEITTLTFSTIKSLQKALDLITPGGAINITAYPGHTEGKREEELLLELFTKLDKRIWSVSFHQWINRHLSPSLFFIQKSKNFSTLL